MLPESAGQEAETDQKLWEEDSSTRIEGGVFTNSKFIENQYEDFDTLVLYTESEEFHDGTIDRMDGSGDEHKILSTAEYFMDLTQGEISEHCVWNAGIGGFIAPYSANAHKGNVVINIRRGQFDYHSAVLLRIVEKGHQDTVVDLDLGKSGNVIVRQERSEANTSSEEQILNISEMERGQVYTGSFSAVRIDDESRASMLAGFFDRNVKLAVDQEGRVTATFYNNVFAHSMIGGVNMIAMGGSTAIFDRLDQYTKVRMNFDDKVKLGFTDFESKKMRLSQDKLRNRALMGVKGLDQNGDGYISRQEMADFDFDSKLDFSLHAMYSFYSIKDDFGLSDISWLSQIGKPGRIESLNFNGLKLNKLGKEFSNFQNLRDLNLSANVITEIADGAFRRNGKLKSLRISSNMLQHITKDTFRGLTGLEGEKDEDGGYSDNFSLSDNQIVEIDADAFQDLQKVRSFDFTGNPMETINKDNDISAIFGSNPGRVSTLSFENNKLSELPRNFDKLSGLSFLNLRGNRLYNIGGSLDGLSSLRTLYLDRNLLYYVKGSLISSNPGLEELGLSKNSIVGIPDELLQRMSAKNAGNGFDSIFENNALELGNINLNLLNDAGKQKLREMILKWANKAEFAPAVSAEKGEIRFESKLSALDYFIWARTKDETTDSIIAEAVQRVLGSGRRIDSIEDFRKFRAENLPNLDAEQVKTSILTEAIGDRVTTDALVLKTEIQKFGGGKWYTLEEWTDPQDGSTTTGCISGAVMDKYADDGGTSQWRASGWKVHGQHYYEEGGGSESPAGIHGKPFGAENRADRGCRWTALGIYKVQRHEYRNFSGERAVRLSRTAQLLCPRLRLQQKRYTAGKSCGGRGSQQA